MIRGSIKYPDRYKQLISYAGLERMRNITPTDIDGMIDYGGKCFVYLECKKEGKGLDLGQRVALEHIVQSHEKAGHKACAILFTHTSEPEEIIIAKDREVLMIYMNRAGSFEWKNASGKLTVLAAIERWENYCRNKGYKL